MIKSGRRFPELFTPSSDLDFRRIFHKQQDSLGGVQRVILRDFANLSKALLKESKIYASLNKKIKAKNSDEHFEKKLYAAVSEKLKEIASALNKSGGIFEKRILGNSLNADERKELKQALKILKEFKRSTFNRQVSSIVDREENRLMTKGAIRGLFGLY